MWQRYDLALDEETPGPTHYHTEIKHQRGHKFPKSQRIAFDSGDTPGVGEYVLPTEVSDGVTIPKATKVINYGEN